MTDRQLVRAVLFAVSTLVGVYLVYQARSVVASLVIAVFLAIALAPAVSRVERVIRHRGPSIVLVLLGLIGVLVGLGLLIVPPIVDGIDGIAREAPQWTDDLQHSSWYTDLDEQYDLTAKINDFAAGLPDRVGDAAAIAKSIALGAVGALLQVIVILVMTAFLLLDGDRIARWVVEHAPTARRRRLEAIVDDGFHAVGGYVAGAFTIAFICGASSFIVMSMLGIPFAATLAVLIGFLDLIPLLGAPIGALVVLLVALTGEPSDAIIWAVFFLVYQQIENNLLQPFVYKRSLQLHPLLILLAVLIGSSQLGVFGALFAIPVAATLQIVCRDWWRHRDPDAPDLIVPLIPLEDEIEEVRLEADTVEVVADEADAPASASDAPVVKVDRATIVTDDDPDDPPVADG